MSGKPNPFCVGPAHPQQLLAPSAVLQLGAGQVRLLLPCRYQPRGGEGESLAWLVEGERGRRLRGCSPPLIPPGPRLPEAAPGLSPGHTNGRPAAVPGSVTSRPQHGAQGRGLRALSWGSSGPRLPRPPLGTAPGAPSPTFPCEVRVLRGAGPGRRGHSVGLGWPLAQAPPPQGAGLAGKPSGPCLGAHRALCTQSRGVLVPATAPRPRYPTSLAAGTAFPSPGL